MKLKKILALAFLIGAFFTVNNLRANSFISDLPACDEGAVSYFGLFGGGNDGGCCIGSGGVCPQNGRSCCKGLSCEDTFGGGGKTCK